MHYFLLNCLDKETELYSRLLKEVEFINFSNFEYILGSVSDIDHEIFYCH